MRTRRFDPGKIEPADQRRLELLDNYTLAFKVATDDAYRLLLKRRQSFSREKDVLPEKTVVQAFIDVLAEMNTALEELFE